MGDKTHPFVGYIYVGSATFLWGVAATLGRAAFTGTILGDSTGTPAPVHLFDGKIVDGAVPA
jgi:hypothetical protein